MTVACEFAHCEFPTPSTPLTSLTPFTTRPTHPPADISAGGGSSSTASIELHTLEEEEKEEEAGKQPTTKDTATDGEEEEEEGPHWRKELATLRTLLPYLWPEGETGLRVRVVVSLSLMVLAKLLTVLIPITYKHAVDQLTPQSPTEAMSLPVGWVVAYALLRLGGKACADVRNAVFVRVTQNALKTAALQTFAHLHSLSLRFHVQRKTGGVLRAISRGTQGIMWLLTFLLFNIAPTFIELGLVIMYLLSSYPPYFALAIFITIAGFITYTLLITEWRNKFRRQMNEKDNEANDMSVDSLLNFETVKYFSNEQHELHRYAGALDGYVEVGRW
jgi:ATP-binding cassette, subfamily B, heavy metal transporter